MLESFPLSQYYSEKVFFLLMEFPILGDMIQRSPTQLRQIFEYCKFFRFLPREEVIRNDKYNSWIYYVLKGECLVVDNTLETNPFESKIKAGQMFGALDTVLDTAGIDKVIANPKSEEISLLGLDTSVFNLQSGVRVLNNTTRILYFRSLFDALQKLYWPVQKKIEELSQTEEKDEEEKEDKDQKKEAMDCFVPLEFKGKHGGVEHLVYFDIECKRLGLEIIKAKEQLIEIAEKTENYINIPETFLANKEFNKSAINVFLSDLSFKLRPTAREASPIDNQTSSSTNEKPNSKSVVLMKELRFMVVDDDNQQLNAAVSVLRTLGAQDIHVEHDGSDGWKYLCSHPTEIDVILCDWVMPTVTGIEFFNKIQNASDHLKDIVFIMLTSIESKTSVVDAVESGVHGYVLKPVNQKNILKQIQQALKHVRGTILKI